MGRRGNRWRRVGERGGRGDGKEGRHFGNVADGCVKCETVFAVRRATGQDLPANQSIYRADVVPRVFTTIRP